MKDWKELLDLKRVLAADGAWGTEMIKKGLKSGECPELWNLNRPDDIKAIAKSYIDAEADIILTNTFGGNRLKLKKFGIFEKIEEINYAGVKLSKEVSNNSLVFASMGTTGEFLEPLGTITESEMVESFSVQVKSFVKGNADGILIETMSDLNEIKCAVKAVKENSTLPVVI